MEHKKLRLQPFNQGLYIDLSGLSEKYRDIGRVQVKAAFISHRFIYSSTSLNMWSMFACQSEPILIWSEDDRLKLSYYRLISRHLTNEMKEDKAELEMKHILVFGERYPASNRAMRQAHGAEDLYSIYYKEREKEKDLHKPWPGMEFGKAHLGNAINTAIEQLQYVDPIHSAASTIGRLGGLVKSEAKSTSSRANGRKGGRPKSTQSKSIDMGDI